MTQTEKLSDEELRRRAAEWRRRALQGDLYARGIAHELETEVRRRNGKLPLRFDSLDTRSLESKEKQSRWGRFWRNNLFGV